LRTKSILSLLMKKLDSVNHSDINLYHLSTSLKSMQDRIDVIKALKSPTSENNCLKIPIKSTQKELVINIPKMFEAISFEHIMSDEEKKIENNRQKQEERKLIKIDMPIEDHKYLHQKLEDFKVTFTKDKSIENHSMLKIMKLIGEFAKTKNEEITQNAQSSRLEQYNKDDDKYIDIIRDTLQKEEMNYTYCTQAVLCKLRIPPDVFAKSEQEVISNPSLQFDLLNSEMPEIDETPIPALLTRDTTIEIVKKANNIAFAKFRELNEKVQKIYPNLTHVIVSCLSHDFILDAYGYNEAEFKAAMYKYNVFDDADLAAFMQTKQMELLAI